MAKSLSSHHPALWSRKMNEVSDKRLLDAITIKHGPIEFLSRFFLEADEHIRSRGVRLTVRDDFDELARLNERQTAAGNWHPLVGAFDARHSDLSRDNAYWIAGIDDSGEMRSEAHTSELQSLMRNT